MEREENFYMLKIKHGIDFENVFKKEKGKARVVKKDKELFVKISQEFQLIIFIFKDDEEKQEYIPIEIKLANCHKTDNEDEYQFSIYGNTNATLKMENFCRLLSLNLKNDYDKQQYLTEEFAIEIFRDFKKSLLDNKSIVSSLLHDKKNVSRQEFKQIDEEANICYPHIRKDIERKQFQRDREKILHSKAFRRLVDKAQIFTASKGDHYRTRMTHTLEVAQISRNLARALNLNEDLAEAIALGHDLGHTPFGHQGERTLDMILSGEDEYHIIKNIDTISELKQNFKHNFQSLRVLTFLETKYPDYNGLNLSYETMEGIWKHTKINKYRDEISEFFKYDGMEYLYPEYEFSTSLEGQIVAIADEIAQRSHDIDDAFQSHKLTHDTFIKYSSMKKVKDIVEIDKSINERLDLFDEQGMIYIDKNDMYRAQLCSEIIDYFINDVVQETKDKLKDMRAPLDNVYREKIIDFSLKGTHVNRILSNIITQKVINSSEVAKFDKTASHIIYKLFKYYYENPLCLEGNTLTRIYKEMNAIEKNCLDFRNADIQLVEEEIEKIINLDLSQEDNELIKNEYLLKRKIIARCIADHISGMTDSYALQEFHSLYYI